MATPLFAKVDAGLDDHPKIIAAGYAGSSVFQFLLRLNRARGFDGEIPAKFVRAEYITRRLNLYAATKWIPDPLGFVEFGITRCVDERLLKPVSEDKPVDGPIFGPNRYDIVGWDEEWRGTPSSTLRSRKHREKAKAQRDATGESADATGQRQERRGEEKERRSLLPELDEPMSPEFDPTDALLAAYGSYPRKEGKKRGIAKAVKLVRTPNDLVDFQVACSTMRTAWSGADLQFCPHFSTFVNGEAWRRDSGEDLPSPKDRRAPKATDTRTEDYNL